MKSYKILSWDNHFFGFSVAKIIPGDLKYDSLKKILTELKRKGIPLVYWASNRIDKNFQKVIKSLGGTLVEKKVIYLVNLQALIREYRTFSNTVELYENNKPNDELENLITEGGIYSRFYIDPNISKKQYEKMHKLWIANSTNKKIAKTVLVIKKTGRIVGFIALGEKNGRGNIVYIVVRGDMRGRGLGKILISSAHRWYIYVQAETQEANITACTMYEKVGYHLEKEQDFYHFWL